MQPWCEKPMCLLSSKIELNPCEAFAQGHTLCVHLIALCCVALCCVVLYLCRAHARSSCALCTLLLFLARPPWRSSSTTTFSAALVEVRLNAIIKRKGWDVSVRLVPSLQNNRFLCCVHGTFYSVPSFSSSSQSMPSIAPYHFSFHFALANFCCSLNHCLRSSSHLIRRLSFLILILHL